MKMFVKPGSALSIETYNPQEQSIFPVSSTLITGSTEAILIDAQFSVHDGDKLVDMIKKSSKKLKAIVITSGDPDFYFGLESIVSAFPDAKVIATPKVVKHIQDTKEAKLAYWGPQLKEGAPKKLIVPEALTDTCFYLDGEKVELRRSDSYAAYLWIPSIKVIVGGTGLCWGIYVWTADTQTEASRIEWVNTLNEMLELHPDLVIPGHYRGQLPLRSEVITFTSDYLNAFEYFLKLNKNSQGVIHAMEKAYPHLHGKESLELSAKVNTGEMKW